MDGAVNGRDKAASVTPVAVIPDRAASASVSVSIVDPAELRAARHFLVRYSPLFSMYSKRAWFWQVFVLARRTAFVAISVTLVRTPELRFLAYSLAHLASMLLQLYFEPFSVSFFNRAELVSHVLLVVLSMMLTAVQPPYSRGLQAGLFVLVVPPVLIYAIVAGTSKLRDVRSSQRAEKEEALRRQEQVEADLYAAELCQPSPLSAVSSQQLRALQQQQQEDERQPHAEMEMSNIVIASTDAAESTRADIDARVLPAHTLASDDTGYSSAPL